MSVHPFKQRRLIDVLISKEYLASEQLAPFIDVDDQYLPDELLKNNLVTQTQLTESLAEQFHLEYVELDGFSVLPELFSFLTAGQAFQYHALPYKKENETLYVVISDPFDLTISNTLQNISGLTIKLLLSTKENIESSLKRSEGGSALLKDLTVDFSPVIVKENEQGQERTVALDDLDGTTIDDSTAPVIKLVNTIIMTALQKRVSDIHVETSAKGINIKYRIDGVLYPATELIDTQHQSYLITRLKVMAELDIAEKRKTQDGRFKLRLNDRDIDFRVSILPGIYGEDVVIRILDKSSITQGLDGLSLESLGLEESDSLRFRKSIREPYGMVLITGPTGSGKTTTLYAALNELNTGEEKIITIEDPVEYQLGGVVQIPVNNKKDLTFAKGLRSILRHDPDKIMVGEIRDKETAEIAVQSALTGHTVFSTVHANNVFDVISRFVHFGIDLPSLAASLNSVMSQRLVRKLCPHCKTEVKIADDRLQLSSEEFEEHKEKTWYDAVGCEQCNDTGYHGRTAITEMLDMTQALRDLIIKGRPLGELQKQAKLDGWLSIRQSALLKVISGETSLHEINRVTFID